MLRGMYSSVSAMMSLQANQNVITNNIANVKTVGYKAETVVNKSFDNLMLSNRDRYIDGKGTKQELGALSPGVRIDKVHTNYSQGLVVESKKSTDFALLSKGFFSVQDKNGDVNYTRNGVFNIDSKGYLVTNDGDKVLGVNQRTNKLEPIFIGNQKISMDRNNNILLDSQVGYKFNIVDFDDYDKLINVGHNLIKGDNGKSIQNYKVQNNSKETSNVDILDSTSALMSNLRAFEANQKVVQVMDSTLAKIANEIGTVR